MRTDKIINEELDKLTDEIIANHEKAGQVATGRTKASLSHYMQSPTVGVLEGASYVSVLERGRPPRKSSTESQTFKDNLKQWIQARGLDYRGTQEGLERLAKFLRWHINKNGTKLFRSRNRLDIYTTPISRFEERLTNRLAAEFTADYNNEITK